MKILNALLLASPLLFFTNAKTVKNNYTLSKTFSVTITGSSNLHAWTEKVGSVSGESTVSWNEDNTFDLGSVNINMLVRSIKSDKGAIMNNNTYKALKADDHPQIVFKLTAPINKISLSNVKTLAAKGSLNIAGVTKAIDLLVKTSLIDKNKLVFEGSKTIKMTDYGISPPTALLGTLKTGNEITIDFKTIFILND